MIDNIIRSPREPRSTPMVNYRPDDSVLYARRVVDLGGVSARKPASVAVVTPVPVISKPTARSMDVIMPVKPSQVGPQQVDQIAPIVKEAPVEEKVLASELANETAPAASLAFAGFDSGSSNGFDASLAFGSLSMGAEQVWNNVSKRADWLRYGAVAVVAMLIMALTGYVSIDTWITNNQVKQVVAEKQQSSAAGGMVLGEGEDETAVTPSAIDNYQVAPDFPRVLTIDKLGVKARVLPMSVNADGAMQAPVNIFDSGWYGASAKPGASGAMVIDAHASGATREGLFAYLDTLSVGDQLSVERGDGQSFTYEVVHTETVALESVDMKKLLTPYGAATEGLNLITCTGDWVPDQKTYDQRVMVYTKRV